MDLFSFKIKSYRPKVWIRVNHSEEIQNQLGDIGTVTIRKSLYAPCGEFTLMFPDMPGNVDQNMLLNRDSLYGKLSPLDPIEINLSRIHDEYGEVMERKFGKALPGEPVLRGFIRSVGRNESVGGDGRVQRSVVIQGHDCGAVFIMEQLRAMITAMNTGLPVPAALSYLREYGLHDEPQPLGQFIWGVATQTTDDIMNTAGFKFVKEFSVDKGYAIPKLAMGSDGPVWELIKRYSDAPWNELFVREGPTNPELVFRPTPWKDINGNFLPDATDTGLHYFDIPMSNVISLSAHRDDAEQVNHVFVTNYNIPVQANYHQLTNGFGIINPETRKKFGDRIQEVPCYTGPGRAAISLPEQQQLDANQDFYDWTRDRADWVKKAGTDVYLFEKGSLTIKGNPSIQVGDYIKVLRGPLEWEAYVVGVTHQFQPYRNFLTTIEYIRSNQWMLRKKQFNPWDAERKQGT